MADGTIAKTPEAPPDDPGDLARTAARRERRAGLAWREGTAIAAMTALAGVLPLVVALVALHGHRWFPAMDLALTEMQVRDVGTGDPPLVGLIGRLYGLGERGSHPGPLSFWALWPLYKLFGSSPFALETATAVLNAAAIGLCVGIGHRRGGRLGALGVAAVLVVVARSYGPELLTQPWNPHLPVLWWLVFLLAVWSVLCGDAVLLPLVVFAGTFCAQTHISYVGLVLGVAAPALLLLAWRTAKSGEPDDRRRLLRWGGGSLLLLLVLWLPPIVDQLTGDPGNASILRDAFAHPEYPPIGFGRQALDLWLVHLDPLALLRQQDQTILARDGSTLPGLLLLAVWVGAVALAWRKRDEASLRLHLVVAAALAFGLVSFARILGDPFWWVVLWAWGTTALVVLSVGWTAATALRDEPRIPWATAAAAIASGSVLVGASLLFVGEASSTEVYEPGYSATLSEVAPPTSARLRDAEEESGRAERYLVRWQHPGTFDADPIPYGLALELERDGLDVGTAAEPVRAEIPYRERDPADATAFVDYVVGQAAIERWQRVPGAVEVARGTYRGDPVAVFVSRPDA